MNKICTSIEQSQKLIELGIDIITADMYWCSRKLQWGEITETLIAYPMLPNQEKSREFKYFPAWSLTVLLELTPNNVSLLHFEDAYQAVYDVKPYYITNKSDNPLDAVFEMVCWLKENNKL